MDALGWETALRNEIKKDILEVSFQRRGKKGKIIRAAPLKIYFEGAVYPGWRTSGLHSAESGRPDPGLLSHRPFRTSFRLAVINLPSSFGDAFLSSHSRKNPQ